MEREKYYPEGKLYLTPQNKYFIRDLTTLSQAYTENLTLEAIAIACDLDHNLIVDLNGIRGIIPRSEGAYSIDDTEVKDIAIISKVNKPVCFKIKNFDKTSSGEDIVYLSRKMAQKECIDNYIKKLISGDVIEGRVTHLDNFGCFVDIGRGYSSLLPIDSISISRISHPRDRFKTNCDIYVVVKGIDDFGRIILTHKELLGTWEQNATAFLAGETVSGIIRSIEEYGIFIELLPNLAGLAELVETAKIGQKSSVYIKSLIAQKMKIKLVCVDHFDDDKLTIKTCGLASGCFKYYLDGMKKSTNSLIIGHIDKWIYSPENCIKTIQTVF